MPSFLDFTINDDGCFDLTTENTLQRHLFRKKILSAAENQKELNSKREILKENVRKLASKVFANIDHTLPDYN